LLIPGEIDILLPFCEAQATMEEGEEQESGEQEKVFCWEADCGCSTEQENLAYYMCSECHHLNETHVSSQQFALINKVLEGYLNQLRLSKALIFASPSGVDAVPWTQMDNAYTGAQIGRMLKCLITSSLVSFRRSIKALELNVYHQGSLYESTVRYRYFSEVTREVIYSSRVVPFFARMIREPQIKFRHNILKLLSQMAFPHHFGSHWNLVPFLSPSICYNVSSSTRRYMKKTPIWSQDILRNSTRPQRKWLQPWNKKFLHSSHSSQILRKIPEFAV